MIDEQILPEPIPHMTAAKAEHVARTMQAWALHMEELGVIAEARLAQHKATWWMTYATQLKATGS